MRPGHPGSRDGRPGVPVDRAEIQVPTLDVKFAVPPGGVLVVKDVPPGVYVVQAKRLGFAIQSRIVHVGSDTTASDLRESRAVVISQFLKRARGIIVNYGSPNKGTADVVSSTRCGAVSVYLDGQPLSPTIHRMTNYIGAGAKEHDDPVFDINVVPVSMVSAIEVYTELATIPAEYRFPGQECGAVFLCTS